MPDEEEINRNLKGLQWEYDNNSGKDGIDDGEDDFKEPAQELYIEKWLGEPVEQNLAEILETIWQNWQSYKKLKNEMKIYSRPENFSSPVVENSTKKLAR